MDIKANHFLQYAVAGAAFLIIDNAADYIIGSTRYYDYQPNELSISVGFTFLSRDSWGGFYNRSAKRLLLDFAFQFVDKVYFHIGATNVRSQVATTKIGAVKFKEIDIDNNGQSQLHYEYVINKKDW